MPGKKEIWSVGERVQLLLADVGYSSTKLFSLPNSVNAITPLVWEILVKSEESQENGEINDIYIFHNQPKSGAGYIPISQRLLPLDEKWRNSIAEFQWPTNQIPEVIGNSKSTLLALINAYLFISLFRACAESLASENASRLAAMQRAEKNIDELLEELKQTFHRQRQTGIDEELFDVIAGYELLSKGT